MELLSSIKRFFSSFGVSIIVFGLIAFISVKFAFSAFDLTDNGNEQPPVSIDTESNAVGTDNTANGSEWLEIGGESFSVLFVGTDYLPNYFDDYDDTDELGENGFPIEKRTIKTETLIFVHINKETGSCVFTSIPTDQRVIIDGYPRNLEDIYAEKGIKTLCEKVNAMTGLKVDYYAIINPSSFVSFVNSLGGIRYYVEKDMVYEDETKGISVNLRGGSQKLNGNQALGMLRYPDYQDGNISKRKCSVKFTRELLKLYLTQMVNADSEKNNSTEKFIQKTLEYFNTNIKLEDVIRNKDLILSYSKMSITNYSYSGTVHSSGNDEYFSVNLDDALNYFSKFKG